MMSTIPSFLIKAFYSEGLDNDLIALIPMQKHTSRPQTYSNICMCIICTHTLGSECRLRSYFWISGGILSEILV